MHREVAEVGGTYTLRVPGEVYASDFARESDLLTPDNAIPWQRNAEERDVACSDP